MTGLKQALRTGLGSVGLLRASQLLRAYMRHGASGPRVYRFMEETPQRTAAFVRRYADLFASVRTEPRPHAKLVLIIGSGASGRAERELCLVKALELAGWRAVCLQIDRSSFANKAPTSYYSLIPSTALRYWEDYFRPAAFHDEADRVVRGARSLEELLQFRIGAVRAGGHAVSTARRHTRIGALELDHEAIRVKLISRLAASMASAAAIKQLIQELHPALILTEDTAYTPRGEILDVCGQAGIPVIRWFAAHKAGALMLKRYTAANRDADINSLSDNSWRFVREIDWTAHRSEMLKRELTIGYARKEWYNEDGAQFNTRQLDADAIRKRLRLDPRKKTAIVFPHIAYDASFGRGEDLFTSYDEWLIETVRAACANDKLQWIVKIHPAHRGKRIWYSRRMPDEENTLRARFGRLPKHVSIIPALSDISTLSLFPVMDYCLTVRGTVGVEAACRGIPVLTGGTGRYDRKGFTIDSTNAEQYFAHIARLQDISPLSPAQIELAERFAYGLFLLRPLPLSSISIKYDKEWTLENVLNSIKINLRNRKDWEEALDLRAFAEWATTSDEEDFLLRADSGA